jgi:hypothetical protein
MKAFFHKIIDLLESLGRARAASELARSGHYKEAQALMLDK